MAVNKISLSELMYPVHKRISDSDAKIDFYKNLPDDKEKETILKKAKFEKKFLIELKETYNKQFKDDAVDPIIAGSIVHTMRRNYSETNYCHIESAIAEEIGDMLANRIYVLRHLGVEDIRNETLISGIIGIARAHDYAKRLRKFYMSSNVGSMNTPEKQRRSDKAVLMRCIADRLKPISDELVDFDDVADATFDIKTLRRIVLEELIENVKMTCSTHDAEHMLVVLYEAVGDYNRMINIKSNKTISQDEIYIVREMMYDNDESPTLHGIFYDIDEAVSYIDFMVKDVTNIKHFKPSGAKLSSYHEVVHTVERSFGTYEIVRTKR